MGATTTIVLFSLFVWTIEDLIGLVGFGLIAAFFLFLWLGEKLDAWMNRKRLNDREDD